MKNGFFAMVSRMRYINRWSLMRNTRCENIEEHSLQVAVIAHGISLIRRKYYPLDNKGEPRLEINPDYAATLSVFHDTNEIITGDMPTPVKYFNPSIAQAYKDVEIYAAKKLLGSLPEELSGEYAKWLLPDKGDPATAETLKIVKAADKISALIKCIEEEKAGNREFVSAKKNLMKIIESTDLPEVEHFVKNFLPSYSKNLDELEGG